jgi:hypothetical protein
MVGLVTGFVLFGFFAVVLGSEVFSRTFDIERFAGFILMLAVAVPLGWVIVTRIVRRDRRAWHRDCIRAGAIALAVFAVGTALIAVAVPIETDGDLGREVYFDPRPQSSGNGFYWPAINSVIFWAFITAFAASVSVIVWRNSLPKRRKPRRNR